MIERGECSVFESRPAAATQKFNHPLTIHRLVGTYRGSSSQGRKTSNWTLQDMVTLTLIPRTDADARSSVHDWRCGNTIRDETMKAFGGG
jgi:hypothetical protein